MENLAPKRTRECRILQTGVLALCFTFLTSVGLSQEIQTDSSSDSSSPPYDQMQVQNDSFYQNNIQLGDIQLNELETFDTSTIPEKTDLPDADWIFEVPIDVKNISPEIDKIGVIAIVFKFMKDGKRVDLGKAKARIELKNGAYTGKVTIGVPYDEEAAKKARKKYNTGKFLPGDAEEYECWMYLIGPDNRWKYPSLKQIQPTWRMANDNYPFKWKTGRHPLPKTYPGKNGSFDEGSVGQPGEANPPQGLPDLSDLPINQPASTNENKSTTNKSFGTVGESED